MNRRRLLIIILGLLVIALIGGFIYWYRYGTSSGDTSGSLPDIGAGFNQFQPTTTTLDEAVVPIDGLIAYYAYPDNSVIGVRRDGVILRVVGDTPSTLSDTKITNFASASFSADGSQILVLSGQQPRVQVNIFETASASWRVIPGSFRAAAWSPKGNQLAILTPDAKTGKTSIALYNPETGKTVRTIATVGFGDVSISWPASNTIIVQDKATARSVGAAWAIDVPTGKITLAARGKQGFTGLWGPTGKEAIAFQSNPATGRGGSLRMFVDAIDRGAFAFTTIPDKCTFFSLAGSGNSTIPHVICGVPSEQEKFLVNTLPDAWYRQAITTSDNLIGINLETREVDMTIAPPLPTDITNVRVVGNQVYYTDRVSGALYHAEI